MIPVIDKYGDIQVACVRSGLVLLLPHVILDQHLYVDVRKDFIEHGVGFFYPGKECPGCRSTPSTSSDTSRMGFCTYKAVVGPVFAPRAGP